MPRGHCCASGSICVAGWRVARRVNAVVVRRLVRSVRESMMASEVLDGGAGEMCGRQQSLDDRCPRVAEVPGHNADRYRRGFDSAARQDFRPVGRQQLPNVHIGQCGRKVLVLRLSAHNLAENPPPIPIGNGQLPRAHEAARQKDPGHLDEPLAPVREAEEVEVVGGSPQGRGEGAGDMVVGGEEGGGGDRRQVASERGIENQFKNYQNPAHNRADFAGEVSERAGEHGA